MNPAQQEEQRLQERYDAAEAEVETALRKILKKNIEFLTDADIRFLRGRRHMLDDQQLAKYQSVLQKETEKGDSEEEQAIEQMTRRELEAMAISIGIEHPEDKKQYRTNADLQEAIKSKQKENEE